MGNIDINKKLLDEIDKLELSERLIAWKQAVKDEPWKIYADRERYTVQSWKMTEGEDIEIRRAKLLRHVLENIEITILDFDTIAGRSTPGVIGACTSLDVCGDYIPDIWRDGEVNMTLNADARISREDLQLLRESAALFRGKTAPDMTMKAWSAVYGDWGRGVTDAKVKDPSLDAGIFGNVTSVMQWEKVITKGLNSFISEAQNHIDEFIISQDSDISKLYFWQSSIIVLEAAIIFSNRYAQLAEDMAANEKSPVRKAELAEIARICRHVPANPARSFHEALQAMSIIATCKLLEHPMHNNPHWGRGDQYLYPFFIKDIESGAATLEKAAELLSELLGRWGTQAFVTGETQRESHQVNFGINNVLLGGANKKGEDASNELSYLFLHMVGKLRLSSPTVGIRWNRNTPGWLMRKAIMTNLETKGGIPLFQNDENMIRHYMDDGIPYEEACEWCGLGCVYPCLPTRAEHYGAEGIAGYNWAAILHMTLHNGKAITGKQLGLETGDPREFKTFDDLYSALKTQHKYFIERIFRLAAIAREVQPAYLRLPFISTIGLEASMELGQDVLVPHPDYALFGISDRAIIDVADSLVALRKLVFECNTLTLDEMIDALESNFEGARGEEIRRMCLNAPKFGNDADEADMMAKELSEYSASVIKGYDNSPFKNYMIAREGLAWHYFGGLGAGALPNGHKALEPLYDGSVSPMRGADTHGPTAVIRSVLKAGFDDSYAHVLNQKFSAEMLQSPESVDKLVSFTNTFFKNGGTHIQYNITDREELLEAKEKPQEHKDLIVRIGGFSAYFVQLSHEIQNDVIDRSEHML